MLNEDIIATNILGAIKALNFSLNLCPSIKLDSCLYPYLFLLMGHLVTFAFSFSSRRTIKYVCKRSCCQQIRAARFQFYSTVFPWWEWNIYINVFAVLLVFYPFSFGHCVVCLRRTASDYPFVSSNFSKWCVTASVA